MFREALLIIAKKRKPKCQSTDEWINKIWYIQTTDYYMSKKGMKY